MKNVTRDAFFEASEWCTDAHFFCSGQWLETHCSGPGMVMILFIADNFSSILHMRYGAKIKCPQFRSISCKDGCSTASTWHCCRSIVLIRHLLQSSSKRNEGATMPGVPLSLSKNNNTIMSALNVLLEAAKMVEYDQGKKCLSWAKIL